MNSRNFIISAQPNQATFPVVNIHEVIVASGIQGPPGVFIPGNLSLLADADIGSQRVVKVTSTGCNYADSSNTLDSGKVVGFTFQSATLGSLIKIISEGTLNGFYALLPGLPIYLGLNGLITQVPVTSGIHQQLGVASSTDSIIISISQPITLE